MSIAHGNVIVSSAQALGKFVEGIIGAGLSPKPGTALQIQVGTAPVQGADTWELYNADVDGGRPKGPIIILRENYLLGQDMNTAYAAGDRAFGYIPLPGDMLNLLIKNLPGTADDHTRGETLIINKGTGMFIATTGSPEDEVAQLQETITDPVADTLAFCKWTGY